MISIDKDLRINIPGIHFSYYRPIKKTNMDLKKYQKWFFSHVSKEEAELNFGRVCSLETVRTELKAVPGIGKVKEPKYFQLLKTISYQ